MALTPTAFLERLAVLVPRSYVNLVLFHGLSAPRAAWADLRRGPFEIDVWPVPAMAVGGGSWH